MIYKRFRESEDLMVRAVVDEDGICRLPEDYYDDEDLRSEIKKIIVPKDAIEIEEEAFSYCENLESVVLPEGLDIIGDNAFDECPNLKNVVIPSSVTKIGPYAFFGCGLESVKVPAGVTEIEDGCFGSCMDLVNIEIPEGVTSIGDAALARIAAERVHLPSTVKFIYEKAFDDCKNLVDINIPKSVTYIGAYAFHGCTKLNELVVPADCEVEEQDLSRNQHGEHIINIIRESRRVSPRRFRESSSNEAVKCGRSFADNVINEMYAEGKSDMFVRNQLEDWLSQANEEAVIEDLLDNGWDRSYGRKYREMDQRAFCKGFINFLSVFLGRLECQMKSGSNYDLLNDF